MNILILLDDEGTNRVVNIKGVTNNDEKKR